MNKNFSQLKTNVGAEVGDTSTGFKTLIGRFLNRRYFEILRVINWSNIRSDYTFDTTSGTQNYTLPADFGKEVSCYDTTNGNLLAHATLSELYRFYGSSIATQGTIERYAIYDDNVRQQPSSASQLTIVSSSASDTTQTILVRGYDANGVELYESVSLNGTTNATTTNSYARIKALSKSAVTTGYVTITDGTNTLTILAPEELESRVKLIKFHYKPAATATIHLPYIVKPLPLSQDYDYPVIDCADALEIGAIADGWRYKRQMAKAREYDRMFQSLIADMTWDMENQPNRINQLIPETYNNDSLY